MAILQTVKLRLRGAKQMAQVYPASKRQSQDLNLALSDSVCALVMHCHNVRFRAKQCQVQNLQAWQGEIVNFKPSLFY